MIMQKKSQFLFIALISISIFLISSNRIFAREGKGDFIIVNKHVGDYINQGRRNKDSLLLAFEGFQPMLFLELYGGKMNIAFPNISFGLNPFIKGDLIQTVDLLKVRF